MALQVRRNSSVKVRVITTLMMAFALVAQPMYGLVSSQVAKAMAVTEYVTVYGNTAKSENQPGWLFNRDANNATPFEFTTEEKKIGQGSLYVKPISATPAHKFIAENFLLTPMKEVESISYDFKIGNGGGVADANEFYMNVYANFDGSTRYGDCVYNVVPTTTAGWTTVTFDPNSEYSVTTRGSAAPNNCPKSPSDLPNDALLRAFALNVGGTSASDVGLDGYLDNVIVATATEVTTYDFEYVADPNNQNVQRFSGDVYRDIALDNCDSKTECETRTNERLANWEMRLYREDGNRAWQRISTATTNTEGKYNFGSFQEAGVYHVCEVLKSGWTQPIQNWGGSGYLVNTPNASGVKDEGKYCTTTTYADVKDNSSVSHFGNVDISAPVISNISINPRAENGNIGGTVTVTFDLNDVHPIDVAKTRVLFSDGPNDTNRARESVQNPVRIEGNKYKAVFNTKSFVQKGYTGSYNLGFNPYDSLGNQTSSKPVSFRNILIDNAGPSIGNKTPGGDEQIGGLYNVSATVNDASGVDDSSVYARFRDDAGREYTHYLAREGNTNVYSKLVDTRTIINKATSQPNRVSFAAEDMFGTSRSSVSDGVVIDNSNPIIQSAALSDILIDDDDINPTLSAYIDGTGSSVKNVQYRIHTKAGAEVDGFSWVEVAAKDGTYDSVTELASGEVVVGGLADGEYIARVRAFDAVGNKKSGVDVAFAVDRTAPVASITSHNDGDAISGLVALVGKVVDVNPMNTHFKITGPNKYVKTATNKDSQDEHQLTWDVSALPNGTYAVQFETRDRAGNKTAASTVKINLVVDNPQPVVAGENFNTHDGEGYKGINVGFNIANFKTVSDISVSLFNEADELLVTNTPDKEGNLLALITSGVKQLSTPFIITPGTYLEEYWTLGSRNWMVADKPATAIVTVTGTNNAGVEVSAEDTLSLLTESNDWTFESLLPKTSIPPVTGSDNETDDQLNDDRNPAGESNRAAANGSDEEGDDSEVSTPFARGTAAGNLFAANFAVAGQNSDDEDEDVKEDDAAVLGTQDTGTPLSNTGAIVADDAGFSLAGLSWYWWLGILGAAVAGWLWIAAGIRRMRGTDI